MLTLPSHPVFSEAIADIESLGVRVTTRPIKGATPYTIIDGRSNARWWILPLLNSQVTTSSLALFQPILTSAGVIKWTAATLTRLGLGILWARPRLYLSGTPCIGKHFENQALSYAYFTGTDSPHRKVAVQVMKVSGCLQGFAKVTRNPFVRPLLQHEAATITRVSKLALSCAIVPKVLFCGEENGTSLLVTDTLKTSSTKSTTALGPTHITFLRELADKTAVSGQAQTKSYAKLLCHRLNLLRERLSIDWQYRLQRAIDHISSVPEEYLLPASLTHGDFTPWNTFIVDQKLYVFDWEYAEEQGPASNDLTHFLLSQPCMRNRSTSERLNTIIRALEKHYTFTAKNMAMPHLLIYLSSHTLRCIERCTQESGRIEAWDSEYESAALIDSVLN